MNQNPTIRDLLCNRRAYRTFSYAAWWMVPLSLVILIALTPAFDAINASALTRIGFQVISGLVGAVGAVAGIVIFLGMLAYLFLFDRTSRKLLWLLVFFFTACFGSSIYFFTVYRRQAAAQLADRRG